MKLIRLFSFVLLVALISACEDDIPAVEYKSQGFVEGTIDATASDDETDINETFRYTQYRQTLSLNEEGFTGYTMDDDGGIEVVIFRQDLVNGANVTIGFYLEDEDDTTPEDLYFRIVFIKENRDNIVYFNMSSSSNDFEIDDFTFDMATGNTTGTFTLEGTNNSTGNEAEVEGSFNVKLRPLIY